MKRSRLANLILAAVVGLTTGVPTTSVADDTEIYLGASVGEDGIRPNVLFILDTSGSMSGFVDSNGDRLDHMKDAFNQIMDTVNNINVGLMRFTDPGGPILWPVTYVDEDVTNIESLGSGVGFPINVRVSDGADDAEEIITAGPNFGNVDIASSALEIAEIVSLGGSVTQTLSDANDVGMRVINQNNNAEEDSDDDIITANQIDMNPNQFDAVRFNSVPIPADSIPGGVGACPGPAVCAVTVDDARVIFTARNGDSDSPTFELSGHDTLTPPTFPTSCSNCADVTNRTKTTARVTWQPAPWSTNEKGADTTTEDLSPIVQELIRQAGWPTAPALGAGNPMVFRIGPSTTGGQRRAYTFQGSGSNKNRRPELQITYSVNTGVATDEDQLIGMRFQEVAIPAGATITSAVLEFFPSEVLSGDIDVTISGEAADDSAAFTTANSDLSSRTETSVAGRVNWVQTDDWDDVNVPQQTDDITTIIQEIVNRPGWCGNNALTLLIKENNDGDNLNAFSFDGDQSRAPMLRVDFDEATVPANACINVTVTSQIFSSTDDAEETISTGNISLGGAQFDMRGSQINGLRFTQIPISQGATITSADLTFIVRNTDSNATTLTFQTEAIDDAPTFNGAQNNISDRSTGPSSVNWAAPAFAAQGDVHITVDIAPIIRDVINRPGWAASNSLVIIQSHSSGSRRRARTFNHNPVDAPLLTIRTEGVNATAPITVRNKLKTIVDGLDHDGFTPIVDTLYEAAKYYRGEEVVWGKQRGFDNDPSDPFFDSSCASSPHLCNSSGGNPNVRRNTRISHPASWTGGTIVKPAGCTDTNLNASQCENEIVTGPATYVTPIEEACQANYIVLLTDGAANHNDSVNDIQGDFGITCSGGATANETCGEELAEFLNTEDQVAGLAGDQGIITYTIGFNFSNSFLGDMAVAGGGEFFTADTGAELADVFQTIIADILSRSTSFATPSLSVNAFNKLEDLNDVYFSLFTPDTRQAWRGNVKRYQLCDSSALCELGEVLDANADPAIDEADKRIKDEAISFWSTVADGAEIEIGGAAENIPDATDRNVFTYHDVENKLGGGPFTDVPPLDNPIGVDLGLTVNEVIDADGNGLIDGFEGHADHPDPLADTRYLLGDDAGLLSDAQRSELIDWIRGVDVDDEDEDTNVTENRFVFPDPLHSSPVAITFGGSEEDPVIKLFLGSNDGGIRMLNAFNGIEEWVFYPQDMMRIQADLRVNSNGEHLYGVDGVPAQWIFDADEDGVIEQADGDFVRLIIGQRRGGPNYYALDVTPSNPLTDPSATGGIIPELMWRIEGGSTDFPLLGDTWSRPTVSRVRLGTLNAGETEIVDVIAFGGGYDVGQDDGFFGPSSPGNAVYFAKALDGELIFTVSADNPGTGDNLIYPDMDCPIPSDLSFFDANGDGTRNRIYVGDLCGKVHRIDIRPNTTAAEGIKATAGLFAQLSETDPDPLLVEDHRKIFFKPSVVQILNSEFSIPGETRYDLVVVVTGLRNNPLNLDVTDRAYALRELLVDAFVDADENGVPDQTYLPIQGPTVASAGVLFDATEVVVIDTEEVGGELADLQNSKGWFIDLTAPGEKALASPDVLAGALTFTSYLPEGVVDASSCSLAEGSGLQYGVNVLTGGVVFNFDDADGTEELTLSDKTFTLGAGIPSSAVPIFQEEGITYLTGGGGATVFNPGAEIPRGRSFWYEQ